MLQKEYDLVVVGAGPAGLMAAIECNQPVGKVLVLEKMHQPALKLKLSGKGRCNITNGADLKDFITHFGKNGKFLKYAFAEFFNKDLLRYFEKSGLQFKLERGGRYFPLSDDAKDVADALLDRLKARNIPVVTGTNVTSIRKTNDGDFVLYVRQQEEHATISARKVLLATGGKSYPRTGSDGSGFKLAADLGHRIISPRPSLVPLVTKGDDAKKLQGLSLRNARAELWSENKKVCDQFGEMLFTEDGVSGPIILSISRCAVPRINEKQKLMLTIDLKPALDHKTLDQRLQREIAAHPKKGYKSLLTTLLPKKMVSVFIDKTAIPEDKPLHQINSLERKKLRQLLKEFPMEITGCKSFEKAIVTAGGVCIKQVHPQTMESRILKGLYFAGEMIDVDADTGGYNLQAAFSMGWVAGRALQKK